MSVLPASHWLLLFVVLYDLVPSEKDVQTMFTTWLRHNIGIVIPPSPDLFACHFDVLLP